MNVILRGRKKVHKIGSSNQQTVRSCSGKPCTVTTDITACGIIVHTDMDTCTKKSVTCKSCLKSIKKCRYCEKEF